MCVCGGALGLRDMQTLQNSLERMGLKDIFNLKRIEIDMFL